MTSSRSPEALLTEPTTGSLASPEAISHSSGTQPSTVSSGPATLSSALRWDLRSAGLNSGSSCSLSLSITCSASARDLMTFIWVSTDDASVVSPDITACTSMTLACRASIMTMVLAVYFGVICKPASTARVVMTRTVVRITQRRRRSTASRSLTSIPPSAGWVA